MIILPAGLFEANTYSSVAQMSGSDDVSAGTDIISSCAESLLDGVQVSRERFPIVRIAENNDSFNLGLNRGRQLGDGEMDELATLAKSGGTKLSV